MSVGARIAKPETASPARTPNRPFALAPNGRGEHEQRAPAKRAYGAHAFVAAFDVVALTFASVSAEVGAAWVAGYVAAVLAVGLVQHAYSARIAPSMLDAIPTVLTQASTPIVFLGPIAVARGTESTLWLPLLAFVALVISRAASTTLVRGLRRRGRLLERALIVGAGQHSDVIARTLREHREYGIEPVGFVDECRDELDPPVLGTIDDLESLLDRYGIDRVLVAFGTTPEPRIVELLRACETRRIDVHVVPRLFELGVSTSHGADAEEVWGIPLVRVRRTVRRPAGRAVKRAFDIAFASVALVLLAPVMLACAALVRISGPGPILFRQKRVGHDERLFEVLKFRTMPVNDDSDTTWNVDDDERMTRIGRFLRRTTLDELPQLVNVLRGEMAIVGPRPERPRFVDEFGDSIPRYRDRHRIPGGLTGWAQAHNLRGNTSIEERTRFDNYYIENWSLWRDVVTLFKTVGAVFRGPK